MSSIEQLAARLRRKLRINGFPGAEGTARLVHSLEGRVRVHEDPAEQFGYCRHWEDGTTTIWVPLGATEILAHELGHHFLTADRTPSIELSPEWLERAEERPEEVLANQFARAWLLPPELCHGSEGEIAQASGCSLAMVRRRLQELRGQ